MARIVWTEPALHDIEAIADYISLDKPDAAKKLVRRIFETVQKLRRFPQMGSVPAEISDLLYRQLIVGPCRIFYRVDGQRVYIVHVMRGEQMLRLDKARSLRTKLNLDTSSPSFDSIAGHIALLKRAQGPGQPQVSDKENIDES